jgi:hypothetical protein
MEVGHHPAAGNDINVVAPAVSSAAWSTGRRRGCAGGVALGGRLIDDEPVSERRVEVVDADGGVDQVVVVPVPLPDRVGSPLAECLPGEPERPAGHRGQDPGCGRVKDQWKRHFRL